MSWSVHVGSLCIKPEKEMLMSDTEHNVDNVSKVRIGIKLVQFFWQDKWWWLTPMVFLLLLFSVMLIFAQSSAITPLLYVLF